MGNRANVYVIDQTDPRLGTYLYTHSDGGRLPAIVQTALRRSGDRLGRQRNGKYFFDGPYITRIIFCEMVKNDIEGRLHYGISATCSDGADRILVIDMRESRIGVASGAEPVPEPTKWWGLDEFLELAPDAVWAALLELPHTGPYR